MSERQILFKKYYYPQCKELGCNGLLNIKLKDNFTLEYECDINKNHNSKKIFFKTFERFYLKKKEINKCSNCDSILDNDVLYKCKTCSNIYCTICFTKDEHIKNDMNNLEIEGNKCKLHNKELNYYCCNCKKYICNYCLKIEEHNTFHKIINLIRIMPSKQQIMKLKNEIKKRNNANKEIIDSINEWEKALLIKTNRIKQNLKDEISLLTKIIDDYNQYFLNFTYYSIFYEIKNYINNKQFEILEKLKNNYNFDEKKDIIFEKLNIFKNKDGNVIESKGYLDPCYPKKNGIIEKINNSFFFEYLKNANKIHLCKYDKNTGKIISLFETAFNDDIYSISILKEKNQIYLCLLKKKIVKIIDYDLNKKAFIDIRTINDINDTLLHFNKCINISNDLLATSDNKNIIIWDQRNYESNNYNKIKKIQIKTSDLLLANNEYFITSQPDIKLLTIFDIKTLNPEKYIPDIDCIDSLNCFLLFKKYIIINCKKGVALLLIKTKEISQFIDIEISENRHIFLDNKNNICILSQKFKNKTKLGKYNLIIKHLTIKDELFKDEEILDKYNLRITKLKIKDGLFEIFEDCKNIESDVQISKIFCLNDGDFIFQGNLIYILKKRNNPRYLFLSQLKKFF